VQSSDTPPGRNDAEEQVEIPSQDGGGEGRKDWKRLLPGLIISAISLVVVLYLAKPGRLYQALRLADYRLVLVALLFGFAWLAVRAMAWRTLLQNKAAFTPVFFTVNEGYLLNNVLPFRLGEVARAFLLSHKASLSFWEVIPSIIIERVLDLAFAAGLLLATLPFVVGATWARQAAMGSAVIVLVGLLGLYLLARYRDWALAQFHRLGQRWPALLKVGGHSVEAFLNGLAVITDGRLFLLAVFWILLDWLIALGQYYLIMLAFIPQAKFLWTAFTLSASALGIAAPSSPGAVGVYELVVVGALSLFGIQAATALAFALTAHLSQYLLVGVLGTIGLARDGESLISVYSRVRHIPNQSSP
jgi:glycosyltransferase 2 family protein